MTTHRLLSEQDICNFQREGFLVMRQWFGPQEIGEITRWTDQVASSPEVPGKYMMYFENSINQTGKRLLSRVENFCPYHQKFAELIQGPKMLGATAELLQEPAVLFKDKINFKLAGGSGFEAHQDVQAGWDAYASLYITAMVTIDATTMENGCLELVAGHHKRGMIGELWKPLAEADTEDMEFIPYPTSPGDVVFFDSFTPHRSAPNLSNRPRRVLYVTYNRLSEGDHRLQYYADKRKSYPPDCERDQGRQYVFRV